MKDHQFRRQKSQTKQERVDCRITIKIKQNSKKSKQRQRQHWLLLLRENTVTAARFQCLKTQSFNVCLKSDKSTMFFRGRGFVMCGRDCFCLSLARVFKVKPGDGWAELTVGVRLLTLTQIYINTHTNTHNTSDVSSTVMLSLASQLSFLFGIRHSGQLQGDIHKGITTKQKQIKCGIQLTCR